MALSYTIVDLPAVWPGKRTVYPKKPPFKSTWTKTEAALERELGWRHGLNAKKITLGLELKRGAMDLRNDGKLKADARPGRAVILSFTDRDGALQVYPCDTYGWWEDNLHAIAVVLEDLRRAERYGVQSSLIRAGFKQLPATTSSAQEFTAPDAGATLSRFSGFGDSSILNDPAVAKAAVRAARGATHPDRHEGRRDDYDLVERAREVLSTHHGVGLG